MDVDTSCIFFRFDYLNVKGFKMSRSIMLNRNAKFSIGEVVKHRIHPFRGVIFDVDPTFDNTEEWWNSIPEDLVSASRIEYAINADWPPLPASAPLDFFL